MASPTQQPVPHWDAGVRELVFRSVRLKQFRRSAPAQELLLAAFHEENWRMVIDDPLPPVHGVNPAQRLRDTVKNLNRTLRPKLIRFGTDGTGQRVFWRDLSALETRPSEQRPAPEKTRPFRKKGPAAKRHARKGRLRS